MKNLKKIAALVIVLAMALSTVSFAAFTDVAADASYNEAVTVMSALGLLKGYEDGSFGPDKTITRAEFAAVVVRMLGMEDAAAGAATATNFTDVPASHWAAGYVKIANQKEIILGYGDGTFGPDDEVTYEQAIKMLVCALGYAPMFAEVKDAYPTSYMAQANTLGMTVGANGKIGDKATRAIVARLAYNALDDKLMEQTGFGTDKNFEQVNKTLLSDYLKVAKVDTTVDPVSFAAEDAAKVTLGTAALASEYDMFYTSFTANNVTYTGNYLMGGTYDAVEGLSIPRGYKVTAFVDYNEDDEVVLAVVPKVGKNETLEITGTQMKDGAVTWYVPDNTQTTNVNEEVKGKLTYYATSSEETGKATEVKLSSDVKVYCNNNTYYTVNSSSDIDNDYDDGAIPTMTLIENTGDSQYDVIIYSKLQSGIVEDIYDSSMRIGTNQGYTYDFDKEMETQTYTLTDVNGKELSFADIKKGDIINTFVSDDNQGNYFYEYIISDGKIEGSVSETSNGKAWINGTEYKDTYGKVDAGDKGIFYVDIVGVILDKELDASSRTFGLLYAIYEDTNGADTEAKATIYTKDGKFENYAFAKNTEFDGVGTQKANLTVNKAQNGTVTSITGPAVTINQQQVTPTLNNTIGLVMYTTNSASEITSITTAANIATATTSEYSAVSSIQNNLKFDATDDTLGGYYIEDETTIVANTNTSLVKDKDAFSISSKAIFADEEQYDVQYVINEYDEVAFIVVFDAKAKVEPTSSVMVVSAAPSTGETEDGDPYSIIRGYVDGKLVSFNVDADTNYYDAETEKAQTPDNVSLADINVGAIIQYSEGDFAPAVRIIATASEVAAIAGGTQDEWADDYRDEDEGYLKSGYVAKYESGAIYFDDDNDGTYVNTEDKVSFKPGAPTVKLANGRVYANNYSISDAETVKNATWNNNAGDETGNDDIVIIYCFDKDSKVCVIIDAANDNRR
ncbi:MAG: S-layer homology domain-containing protein [Ruminococcaceae bacterium]|nr:S-layer homology domain-containing protein [Oscillospiraceae bacterium]